MQHLAKSRLSGIIEVQHQFLPLSRLCGRINRFRTQFFYMVAIELQNLRLQAFHGIYEGEKKTGSPYEVNIKVVYEEGNAQFDDLRDTINYVDILGIIKQRMQIPTPLLEKVAEGIIRRIRHRYPFTREISLSIYKLEAPIENFQGRIGVTMHKQFAE